MLCIPSTPYLLEYPLVDYKQCHCTHYQHHALPHGCEFSYRFINTPELDFSKLASDFIRF